MVDAGPLIVTIIRLIVPFTIIRWPLGGAVASWFVDAFDVVFLDFFGHGWYANYHSTDKLLDTYQLFFLAFVSLRWEPIAKGTSIILFAYRLAGVILFEITNVRWALFFFPNLFENFYFFWAARNRFFPKFQLTIKRLIILLMVLLIPKLVQEYILHILEFNPWYWTKVNLLKGILPP